MTEGNTTKLLDSCKIINMERHKNNRVEPICDIQQRVGEIEEQFGHPATILNQSVEEGRII